MNPLAILDLIKSPAIKIIGIAAMVAAVFFAGYTTSNAFCRADKAESDRQNSQAVAGQAIAIAGHAQKSQSINTEVSNYVQTRTADLNRRFGSGLRHPSSAGAVPVFSGSTSGAATGGTGCISVEQYNDLAWEAGNTAVMVEGWQRWYIEQRTVFEQLLNKINPDGE